MEEPGPTIGVILDYTGTEVSGFNEEPALLLAASLMASAREGEAPIRLVYRDARGKPEYARRAAQELVEAGVDVVIGPSTDQTASAVREVLDEANIVLVSPNPTIGDGASGEQPWFRMSPGNLAGSTTPALIGEHMAREAVSRADLRAAILTDDDVYNLELARGFRAGLSSRGGDVVDTQVDGVAAAQRAVDALKQADVDTVVVAMNLVPAARFLWEAYSPAENGPAWLLPPRLKSEMLLVNTPVGALEGAFGVSLRIADRGSRCEDAATGGCFRKVMEDASGSEPFESAYFMYDAAAVVFIAIDKVWRDNGGVIDSTQLREAIFATAGRGGVRIGWNDFETAVDVARSGGSVQYSGVTGSVVFTASGSRVGGETVVFEIKDHEFVNLDK